MKIIIFGTSAMVISYSFIAPLSIARTCARHEDEVMMILINSSDEDISFPTQQTLLFLPSAKKLVNIKNNKENMINKKNTITLKKMNTEIYKIEG